MFLELEEAVSAIAREPTRRVIETRAILAVDSSGRYQLVDSFDPPNAKTKLEVQGSEELFWQLRHRVGLLGGGIYAFIVEGTYHLSVDSPVPKLIAAKVVGEGGTVDWNATVLSPTIQTSD